MQQYGSNGRRPYDQNRDTLRSGTPSGRREPRPEATDNGYGFNGEPLSRPPARSASGTVRRTRTDNSIEFPMQPRRLDQTGAVRSGGARRPQQRPAAQRPRTAAQSRNGAKKQRRPAQPRQNAQQPAAARRYQNQKLRPTPQDRSPVRREKRKQRRLTRAAIRRRRILRRLTAFGLLLCVIAAGVYLTVTMLFRISSIQVQAADGSQLQEAAGYTSDQILQVLGLKEEENIFSFDPAAKEAALEKQFPLLESIRVEREYPNTVVVRVTEAVPTYAMQTSGGWLTLSDQFKILACDAAQPAGLCTLYGGEPDSLTPGDQLTFSSQADVAASASAASDSAAASSAQFLQADGRLDALHTLQAKLEEYGMLADVTRIEFADTEEMAFLYQDRVSVLLGTLNDLDYKLDRARYVLNNEDGKGCAPTDTGKLDFSHISAGSTRKIYFAQGEPTLPSGYVVPPAVDLPAEDATVTDTADTAAPEGTDPADATDTAQTAGETPLTDPERMTATVDENPM